MKQSIVFFGRHVWAVGLLASLMACGQMGRILDNCECGYYINEQQGAMVWPSHSQIRFQFDHDFPVDAALAVELAGGEYGRTLKDLDVVFERGTVRPLDGRKPSQLSHDGINGIYWIEGDWPWGNDEDHTAAMTVVSFGAYGIVEADIYFRAPMFYTNAKRAIQSFRAKTLMATPQMFTDSRYDARWVYLLAVHELGHAIGMVHSSNHEAMMYPTVGEVQAIRSSPLHSSDLSVLERIYTLIQ